MPLGCTSSCFRVDFEIFCGGQRDGMKMARTRQFQLLGKEAKMEAAKYLGRSQNKEQQNDASATLGVVCFLTS